MSSLKTCTHRNLLKLLYLQKMLKILHSSLGSVWRGMEMLMPFLVTTYSKLFKKFMMRITVDYLPKICCKYTCPNEASRLSQGDGMLYFLTDSALFFATI